MLKRSPILLIISPSIAQSPHNIPSYRQFSSQYPLLSPSLLSISPPIANSPYPLLTFPSLYPLLSSILFTISPVHSSSPFSLKKTSHFTLVLQDKKNSLLVCRHLHDCIVMLRKRFSYIRHTLTSGRAVVIGIIKININKQH